MKLLVSGANGFIGRALCDALAADGHVVVRAVRGPQVAPGQVACGEINEKTDWSALLAGVQAVVHLAARAHVLSETHTDAMALYRRVNCAGAVRLAQQAQDAGVQRFIFMSSVKVHGEGDSTPYRETDSPAPQGPYAISKLEAEQALAAQCAQGGMELVILRPPLVYGPGVGANFLRLLRLAEKALPLPLGSIDNRRSLLYIGNLIDAVRRCLTQPAAAGKTYLLADGEALSTPQLLRLLAHALGRPARLWPFPVWGLKLAAALAGRTQEFERLCGSLLVETHAIAQDLGWRAPYDSAQGLQATVDWYRSHHADA